MRTSRNPDTIAAPVGRYVHQIEIESPQKLVFISGQVGIRPDGSVPEDAVEQLAVALENVLRNIEAAGMETSDLVKITTYVVAGSQLDPARRRAEMERLLGDHVPTSTLVFVAALAAPQYKVEIEGVAAR
ncbi:MAG TPA: RidA family protein [Candidatus Limnocylindrales bacterium]|nr:RidA family protein [Candidatus Limnocylindrales bacterium]